MSLASPHSKLGHELPLRFVLPLLLVIVTASLVRLFELERMVVWHDEVYTGVRALGFRQTEIAPTLFGGRLLSAADLLRFQTPDSQHTWADTLHALSRHPEHSPLYYLGARIATQWVEPPILALRGTSAVVSLLLAPAVFWLMRELFGPGKVGWIAAALVSVSPFHLLYAQEARQYALWGLLIAAAAAALLRALRTARTRDWGLYATLVTIGLYSHLLFLVMVPLHGLYAMLERRAEPSGPGPIARPWVTATGVAILVFLPWLSLLALRSDSVKEYIAWMERPVGTLTLLQAWAQHLTRVFVDPTPQFSQWWLLALLPLGWALARFCADAPRPARWLPCLLIAISVATVLGPDLLAGGSRSLHARYTLPALLGVQLCVAWVLAAEWESASPGRRRGAALAFALLVGLGGWSSICILQADTWWNKNFSAENRAIAQVINASDRPLVLASDQGVSAGELISVAYHLRPQVKLWGEPYASAYDLPGGFGDLFALTPSPRLRERLATTHRLEPLLGTWQWYRVEPKASIDRQDTQPQQPSAQRSEPNRRPHSGHAP